MDEKKFKKLINRTGDYARSKVFFSVLPLIKDEDKSKAMIPYKKSFFSRIFKRRKTKKTANQIITDNFDLILENFNCFGSDPQIIKILLEREELRPFLEKKFFQILKIVKEDVDKDTNGYYGTLQYDVKHLVEDFTNGNPDKNKFIVENAEQIARNVNIRELFNVIQVLKGIDGKVDDLLNQILEQNKTEVAEYLMLHNIYGSGVSEYVQEQGSKEYATTLSIMIEELLQSEGKRWIDIKNKASGSYSTVFEIGEKILKIGMPRKTYQIPQTRRILQPLIRTNLDCNGQNIACVEISEKVDVNFEENTEEILYDIYKELREKGIIWTDPKSANIGRLRKDNVVTLNGEEMQVDLTSIGINGTEIEEPLKKGDFVILDTDYIYREDDPELFWGNKADGPVFETRYQQDKQREIANKFRNNLLEQQQGEQEQATEK